MEKKGNGKDGKIDVFRNSDKILKWPDDNEAIQDAMSLMGFNPSTDKEGVFYKHIMQDGAIANTITWDFRKTSAGVFYASKKTTDDEDMLEKQAFRAVQEGRAIMEPQDKTLTKVTVTSGEDSGTIIEVPLYLAKNGNGNGGNAQVIEYTPREGLRYGRGTENHIQQIFNKLKLQSIILSSQKEPQESPYKGETLGNGILYHYIPSIGPEISVEAIDMISIDMGHITTETLRMEQGAIEDDKGNSIPTYFAEVRATDGLTGVSRTAVHEEIVDFKNVKAGRTFAATNAQRKAARNAVKQLIPIPKKALIRLLQDRLRGYKMDHPEQFLKKE